MRRPSVPTLLGALLAVIVPVSVCLAADCEFHGGVYSSWEYTDNYRSTPDNERSDTIYEIGPSAELVFSARPLTWTLSGYAARSYHNRFDQEDDTEIDFTSELVASGRRDNLELGYAYVQTSREDFFRDISGESRIHTGTLGYSRVLSSRSTLGLGYTYRMEDNSRPEQDILNQGGSGTFSTSLTPRDTLSLAAGYDTYDYDITPDAQTLRSSLGFEHALSPRTDVGVSLEYQGQTRDEDLPDSRIGSAYLSLGHSLTQQVRVLLEGGYSRLSTDEADDENAFVTRGEISYRGIRDVLALRLSREYTAEFTTDEYGTYDVRSATATWERELLRTLSQAITITYVERKPLAGADMVTGIGLEEEEDIAGVISLVWSPIRYVDVTSSYEHIREDEEITGESVENRYRIIVEVLY